MKKVIIILFLFVFTFISCEKKVEVADLGDDLLQATEYGDLAEVKRLLEEGADVNFHYNITALMWAAYYGHIEIVGFLIEAGANVNQQDNNGNTALLFAALNPYGGHPGIVELLKNAGAEEIEW